MNNKIAEVGQSAPSTMSRGHHGHCWMMIGCGVMLALVLILVATGAVGATLLIGAAACIAMMAAMMLMMSRSMSGHDRPGNG
jgi:hypothetical protein